MDKKCPQCKHRKSIPGDAHSACGHPKTAGASSDPWGYAMAIFAGAGRGDPVISSAAKELGIKGNKHGILRGWFNWPWNFDPTWLGNCDGFEEEAK